MPPATHHLNSSAGLDCVEFRLTVCVSGTASALNNSTDNWNLQFLVLDPAVINIMALYLGSEESPRCQ